jgi:RNA polymerase sigma factor (sigma-70 family)
VVDDEQAAYDLTAETFAQALVSLHRFRGRDDGDGQAWLFGIARNLGRHFHRDRGIEARARRRLGMPITELSPEYEELEDRLMAQGLGPEVADALGRLSVDQQTAVRLRVVDGLGYAQIAASMGSTEAAARLRVSRALRALRVALDHERGKG